ncbi:hypothetical protein QTI51_09725 [Variovorax sp. J22G73]|nr:MULTISPECIES: hypothetical protein [unclassified Variovorax]MDM0006421.1 hypothetical protein [Variovorax sp. J22R203]MDM0097556.1 hypothetical protein [Variovorax sp. J22G73]
MTTWHVDPRLPCAAFKGREHVSEPQAFHRLFAVLEHAQGALRQGQHAFVVHLASVQIDGAGLEVDLVPPDLRDFVVPGAGIQQEHNEAVGINSRLVVLTCVGFFAQAGEQSVFLGGAQPAQLAPALGHLQARGFVAAMAEHDWRVRRDHVQRLGIADQRLHQRHLAIHCGRGDSFFQTSRLEVDEVALRQVLDGKLARQSVAPADGELPAAATVRAELVTEQLADTADVVAVIDVGQLARAQPGLRERVQRHAGAALAGGFDVLTDLLTALDLPGQSVGLQGAPRGLTDLHTEQRELAVPYGGFRPLEHGHGLLLRG